MLYTYNNRKRSSDIFEGEENDRNRQPRKRSKLQRFKNSTELMGDLLKDTSDVDTLHKLGKMLYTIKPEPITEYFEYNELPESSVKFLNNLKEYILVRNKLLMDDDVKNRWILFNENCVQFKSNDITVCYNNYDINKEDLMVNVGHEFMDSNPIPEEYGDFFTVEKMCTE